jgi:hypothetical protein
MSTSITSTNLKNLLLNPDSTADIVMTSNVLHEMDDEHVESTTDISTTSTTWVDMTGMTLTAVNGGSEVYVISFSACIKNPTKGVAEFILSIDDVTQPATHRGLLLKDNNELVELSFQHMQSISNGSVVKVCWKTEFGTVATQYGYNLIMRGIN